MTPILFAFPRVDQLAAHLCEQLGAQMGTLRWRHFPDGESLLALEGECRGRDVVIVGTLRDPDPLALPLLFAARTARELGARSVGLAAPYLAYMRQDARFHPGEALASAHFASFLSSTFDWLVTVDPHLHRRHDLGALFGIPVEHVTAIPPIGEMDSGQCRESDPDRSRRRECAVGAATRRRDRGAHLGAQQAAAR